MWLEQKELVEGGSLTSFGWQCGFHPKKRKPLEGLMGEGRSTARFCTENAAPIPVAVCGLQGGGLGEGSSREAGEN